MSATDYFDAFTFTTHLGTNGPDTLLGIGFDDEIFIGLGGNDLIVGGGGNDLLLGGDGNDILFAAEAPPFVNTFDFGFNFNVLDGGPGHDSLIGGGGQDFFYFGDNSSPAIPDTILRFDPAHDHVVIHDHTNGNNDLTADAAGVANLLANHVSVVGGTSAKITLSGPGGSGSVVVNNVLPSALNANNVSITTV